MNLVDKLTFEILNEFEELLNVKNINIPSKDREGKKEEARIFSLILGGLPSADLRGNSFFERIKTAQILWFPLIL